MERSEPTLVPEWLRTTGSASEGCNSVHHFVSSSYSDGRSSEHFNRNRSSKSISDKDTPHSAILDRTSSSNSRRSSTSNGSSKHPYSSFSRSHHDKNRDRGKERSIVGDLWDPLGDIIVSSAQKDSLRHSHSLVCRNVSEVLPRRAVDSKNGGSNNHNTKNGVLFGGSLVSSLQKTVLEKDFPSLGAEEKQGVPDIGRVPSPGLNASAQSLVIGNMGLLSGDGWTSALVEVPTIIGSSGMRPSSVRRSVIASSSSGASSPRAGLNMAAALSQAPSRAHTTPRLHDKTQRLEELAIKQSRQLIPMTPSMAKGLGLSSDKSKPKTAVRANEVMAAKSAQQQQHSSQLANQSIRAGQVRSDASRPSQPGKFFVLKPVWENGFSSTAKDVSTPTNNASRVANGQFSTVPAAPATPLKSQNKSNGQVAAALAMNLGSSMEKKPSQAQSRIAFFNHMRKKASPNASSILPNSGVGVLSPTVEKSGEILEGANVPVSLHATENGSEVNDNGDTCDGEKNLCLNGTVYPDEEEAAFLRSLGWEENAGDEDGLTEEEINAFYEEYIKLRPPLKQCGAVLPKLPMLPHSQATGSSSLSSESSSSESVSDA
ncbi:hypothetical protein U1Q18_037047 [Sarracenia purpurea var. burkii]